MMLYGDLAVISPDCRAVLYPQALVLLTVKSSIQEEIVTITCLMHWFFSFYMPLSKLFQPSLFWHLESHNSLIWGPVLCTVTEVPNLWAMDWSWSGPVRNWAAQQEVNLNVMCLNHPEIILPTLVCRKIVFHETGPWCRKGWGPLLYTMVALGKRRGDKAAKSPLWRINLSQYCHIWVPYALLHCFIIIDKSKIGVPSIFLRGCFLLSYWSWSVHFERTRDPSS